MSSNELFDAKERVRQAIDIVELIGGYAQLRREGRNYKALCPWHDDTRPSLQINAERQSFKCWVCNIGGDIFSFMMKMENVEFPEALSLLAERAGITLKPARGVPGTATDEKRPLYAAMQWAHERYHQFLLESPEAAPAREYLAGRNITAESIEKYRLGYAPDRWDWLISQALKTDISPKALETVGLIVRRENGPGHYDRFRGRVLFPIHDVQGRGVALGGRILPQLAGDNLAKYVNSPETPLFSKSNMLYGLDSARDAIGRSRVAVVMEGYTDTIIARQFGFDNTVAVLGTALGERHIPLLRRFADSITLVLDGDEAGQRRANEILSLFVAQQVDLRIVTLPDGLDPADFLLQRGADAFRQLLDSAIDALEHKERSLDARLGPRPTTHQINQAIEEILTTMAPSPRMLSRSSTQARLREHQVLARLARKFSLVEEELRVRLSDLRRTAQSKRAGAAGDAPEAAALIEQILGWERELLEIILLDPGAAAAAAEVVRPEQMESAPAAQLYARCCELSAAGISPEFDRLLLEFDQPHMKNLLVDLDEGVRAKEKVDVDAWTKELLSRLEQRQTDRELDHAVRRLREQKQDTLDELELLNQIIQQERTRQGIPSPTEG